MATKNIGDIIDVPESLENGLKLDIKNVSKKESDERGEFIIITTADGKKYRTYGKFVINALESIKGKKFDFAKDVLRAQVKEVEKDDGTSYLLLVNQT